MSADARITLPPPPVSAEDLEHIAGQLVEHLGAADALLLASCVDEAAEDLAAASMQEVIAADENGHAWASAPVPGTLAHGRKTDEIGCG